MRELTSTLTAAVILLTLSLWSSIAYPSAVVLGHGERYRTWLWRTLERRVFTE